jgi:hypothetical protein
VFTSKSKFDITNPLGSRVDGSTPGVEGVFRLFGAPQGPVSASSSPIQRSVTAIEGLSITQSIELGENGRVDQRVGLGDSAYLRLSASASTEPDQSTRRIDFTFDLAYFQLGPVRIPYPVSLPFHHRSDNRMHSTATLKARDFNVAEADARLANAIIVAT